MYSHMFKGAPLGNQNAKGTHNMGGSGSLSSELDKQISRLSGEAADWAGRQYKPNSNTVHHQGDGPGREFQSIGSINRNRKDNNVATRQAQISALQSVKNMPETQVGSKFAQAQSAARADAQTMRVNGKPMEYEQALEAHIGKQFAGSKDYVSGKNSIGGALRPILEARFPARKPSAQSDAKPADDAWLRTLFGG